MSGPVPVRSANGHIVNAGQLQTAVKRPSWKRFALAFAVAVLSDLVTFWVEFLPPMQWAVDIATALLIFSILGRRWAILPGLVAEAIPGIGVFPVWVLVVISIYLYDDIKARKK